MSCKACITIYTGHIPDESSAHNYDEYYSETNLNIPGFINQRIEEIVAGFELYKIRAACSILVLGAGSILKAAQKLGWDVYGQEVSDPVVERFRKLGFNVFHGELSEAGYSEGYFDVVTASEIVEHLAAPQIIERDS